MSIKPLCSKMILGLDPIPAHEHDDVCDVNGVLFDWDKEYLVTPDKSLYLKGKGPWSSYLEKYIDTEFFCDGTEYDISNRIFCKMDCRMTQKHGKRCMSDAGTFIIKEIDLKYFRIIRELIPKPHFYGF